MAEVTKGVVTCERAELTKPKLEPKLGSRLKRQLGAAPARSMRFRSQPRAPGRERGGGCAHERPRPCAFFRRARALMLEHRGAAALI